MRRGGDGYDHGGRGHDGVCDGTSLEADVSDCRRCVATILGGTDADGPHMGWKERRDQRSRAIAAAWLRGLKALMTRTSSDWITRRFWATGRGYTTDFVLSGDNFHAPAYNTGSSPPGDQLPPLLDAPGRGGRQSGRDAVAQLGALRAPTGAFFRMLRAFS